MNCSLGRGERERKKHTFGGGSSEKVGLARPKPETPAYIILRKPEYARVLCAIFVCSQWFCSKFTLEFSFALEEPHCVTPSTVLGFAN